MISVRAWCPRCTSIHSPFSRKERTVNIELHVLQNFAPSCLNRDDTNSPKECLFGGHRRARMSSQCDKRAIRKAFRDLALLPPELLATRTKRLLEEVTKRLVAAGKDVAQARVVAESVIKGAGLGVKEDGKTEYLLFLGESEIAAFAKACGDHWEALSALAPALDEKAESNKKKKRAAKDAVPDAVKKALEKLLDGGKAADLALFGRMLADLPQKNIDAACQVAHAISTNKVGVEFDFYTAVDDLQQRGEDEGAGAGMMGTVEFNSACFYRYANINLEQLKTNLGKDEELAKRTVEAFLRASVSAIPTGKQNSMAAQNPPSFILAVVRDNGLWSLTNAFVQPVHPDGKGNLVQKSIAATEDYWQKLIKVYGGNGIKVTPAVALDPADLKVLPDAGSFENLVKIVLDNISFKPVKEGTK